MAIYDAGTASLAADGTVTGVGTTWSQPLTLIRVGATMIFNTTPISIVTIAEILSDTSIRAFNDNGFIAPAGTQYFILAHDGITVQGLAQDVAETLRYYQSSETQVSDLVELAKSGDFDFDKLQRLVNEAKASETNAASSASAASASQQAAATSQSQAESSASRAQTAYNNTVDVIAKAGDAGTLVTLAGWGIGNSGGTTTLSSIDFQTFNFIVGANYRLLLSTATNVPAELVYPSTSTLTINVEGGASENNRTMQITASTTQNNAFRRYNLSYNGAPGARVFYVRESLYLPGGGSVGGANAARVRGLLDVYSKSESDAAVKSISSGGTGANTAGQARTNLDVYSKGEVDAKTNRIKVFATDFGFGRAREQNEQALYDIYLYLKESSIPVDLKFPSGIYEIGSQTQSGSMGAGYAFRPSYLDRVWDDESAAGWFSVSNTEMDHVIDMSGCTLKMAPGMKVGSFDPVTGNPFNQGSMETPLFDYNSNTGVMIKVRRAPNIKIINGVTDGNLSEAVFGGKFGNTGYQTLCYNAWFNESLGVQVSGHRFINSPVDGCYFQHTSEFLDTNIISESRFYDCHFTNCGRNCFSLTGGRNVKFSGCIFSNSGRMASSIGENYSGPETCCDIEAESGVLDTISFEDCYLINAGKHSVYTVSVPHNVRNIKFTNSIINSYHSEGAISNVGPTRDVSFVGCRIVGSIIDSGGQFIKNAYTIDSCWLSNNYAGNFVDSYLLSFKVRIFKHNKIEFSIPPSGAVVSAATINISDQDMVTYGVSSSRFYGNEIEVYGDASRVTFANGLGGISNFKSMEIHVNSAGVTNGNLKIIVDSSSVSLNGLTCNSSNFSFSPYNMIKDDSQNIWFADAKTRVNSIVAASATNKVDIGSKTQLFSTIYTQKGIVLQDLVNTSNYYRVRIVNGAINIVRDT